MDLVKDEDVKRIKPEEVLKALDEGAEVFWKLKTSKGDHWSLLRKQYLNASWSDVDFSPESKILFSKRKESK